MKNLNNNVSYIIMGVNGDLSFKKIIPSLWYLYKQNLLPKEHKVIGVDLKDISNEEYKKIIADSIKTNTQSELDNDDFETFFSNFVYVSGDFNEKKLFVDLNNCINSIEEKINECTSKVFYLATNPNLYSSIFKNMADIGLNKSCTADNMWVRILIEKPFGTNLKTSKQLEKLLKKYFDENQIYRIDHYLFKEVIQGIENFRFSNNLFENNWNKNLIEKIEIRLFEKMGVENRGAYYDSVGALIDVGQNHLLAMLSVIISEPPIGNSDAVFQQNRADAINLLAGWSNKNIKNKTKRAQYNNYLAIDGVKDKSKTETYFSIETELKGPKWGGVSVIMEAGKKMNEIKKEIVITLRRPNVCLLCGEEERKSNKIIFRFDPNDEIKILFYTKKPGFKNNIEEREFTFFLYEKEIKNQYVEEYSKIFLNVVKGERARFVSSKEVESSWKFIDPILNSWSKNKVSLEYYEENSKLISQTSELSVSKGDIGMIGLGKMGSNLSRRLAKKGWRVFGYDKSEAVLESLKFENINPASSIEELVSKMNKPRLIWNMIPHESTDEVFKILENVLEEGDVVIDGGNSYYKNSIIKAKEFENKKINFMDVGVSGGPDGALNGACLMIGGSKQVFEKFENLFADISIANGYMYMGDIGAGHFVKMVHNGIEYGMMQSIGEGFEVLKNGPFALNLKNISNLYNNGSVIESRLLNWLHSAYSKFGQDLNEKECCSSEIGQTGEGQWLVDTAKELNIPVSVIEESLKFRKNSKSNPSYTGKIISALRHEFGGHESKN